MELNRVATTKGELITNRINVLTSFTYDKMNFLVHARVDVLLLDKDC